MYKDIMMRAKISIEATTINLLIAERGKTSSYSALMKIYNMSGNIIGV